MQRPQPDSEREEVQALNLVDLAKLLAESPVAPEPAQPAEPERELTEDEQMAASDHRPEQREWRMSFANESEDPAWTQGMRAEIRAKTEKYLQGKLKVENLSCHETVCRMHLQFQDQIDARDFIAAPHDATMEYEFQSLDPAFDGTGFDRSDYTYELMVKRPRPEGLPHRPPAEPDVAPVVLPNEVLAASTEEAQQRAFTVTPPGAP